MSDRNRKINKFLVIADDFTGANDTGLQLAKTGARVNVLFDIKPDFNNQPVNYNADILVINTESRADTPENAAGKVFCAIGAYPAQQIYKKIDSTFRGNVGAEIEAALRASGAKLVLLAPAIPKAGRIVRNAICYVNDIPLCETEFASDPKTPVTSSNIKEILHRQTNLPVHLISSNQLRRRDIASLLERWALNEPSIILFDGETEDDLAAIGDLLPSLPFPYLLAGAAGLAEQLPASLLKHTENNRPVLVIAGSMSEVTRKQIDYARQELSLALIKIDIDALLGKEAHQSISEYAQRAIRLLQKGQHCVLQTAGDDDERASIDRLCQTYQISRKQLGEQISHLMGQLTLNILNNCRIAGLFLTGGDIAIAVAQALGAKGYQIREEVAPCIPCGVFIGGIADDLPVITKAGGFGAETALRDALYFIEEKYREK